MATFKQAFFTTLSRFLGGHPLQPDWSRRDPLHDIYAHIDFNQFIISGSYALHQFTGDTRWDPNDVDIITISTSINHFREGVEKFCGETGGKIIKFADFSEGHPHDPAIDIRDEKFHECIKASAKVVVPEIDLVLQFVYLSVPLSGGVSGESDRRPESVLEEISDLPSCVSYRVDNGKKMFLIPEKGLSALLTRHVSSADICPSRREKYARRFYMFD